MGYPSWVQVMRVTHVECGVAWVIRGLQYLQEPDPSEFNHILKLFDYPLLRNLYPSTNISPNFTIHRSHPHVLHHGAQGFI
jgi:hypothetical protein